VNNNLLCVGINSTTQDNKHILMFDYDIDNIDYMLVDLNKIIDKYKLSKIYIIKTNNGYNAFCFNKFTLEKTYMILSECDNMDKLFLEYGLENNYYTLTINNEKQYFEVIPSTNIIHKSSLAHYLFFKKFMNYNIYPFMNNFDKYDLLSLSFYYSNKHGIKISEV